MVKVTSLNANGLRDYWRRQQALCVCETDIICLQETHWDDRVVEDVRREWLGDVFVSQGEAKARGVAILVKQGVVEGVKMVVNDERGRLVGVSFGYLGRIVKVYCVYAPNEERERRVFFSELGEVWGEDSIVVGDFNVWRGRLDIAVGMVWRSDASRRELEGGMRVGGMIDVWRERNPQGRVFSRRQAVGGVLKQSRIDLVVVDKGIDCRIGRIEYRDTALSDHRVLEFSIGTQVERRKGGVWCMNAVLLKDEKYKVKIREWIEMRKRERLYVDDIGMWWERLKGEVRELSIEYCRARNRLEREREGIRAGLARRQRGPGGGGLVR
ncbi:hypothetical protein NHX12_017226 [Muraenolepis orangiensis]|uniref:exodeoxyribonuclease III n=1 Tax=Muraenolepis orangiensis TaxID=630683 RepID=A0A9Q0D5P8_9TELE|nr:hypothetical protein NHX12_017226 [Muraenolepis orangiensis]